MDLTSASLLQRLRHANDPAAWARLVELYTPLLYHWAERLGQQNADAADLVQDVFVVLVRKLPEFEYDRQKSFRAWLRTVTVNRWRDAQRSRVAQPLDHESPALANLEVEDPTELFDAAEYRSYLTGRALRLIQADFPGPTWQAFWECVVEQRPAADVAAELGVTVNAVYLARGRVLRRLREELEGLL